MRGKKHTQSQEGAKYSDILLTLLTLHSHGPPLSRLPGPGQLQPVAAAVVPEHHQPVPSGQGHQLQHVVEKRLGLLRHPAPLPPREDVGHSPVMAGDIGGIYDVQTVNIKIEISSCFFQ